MRPLHACLLLIAVLLGIYAVITSTPPPPLKPLAKNAVILALGDSLTAGYGGDGVSYPQQLEQLIGKKVINAGISGETSAGAKKRISTLLKQHKPQLLIICTGGNDILRRHSITEAQENISSIITTAQAAGAQVILIAVPRPLPFPINHSMYGDLADTHALWIEDDILKTVLHNNLYKSDQIHANAAGYTKIAVAVADLLKQSGALPQ